MDRQKISQEIVERFIRLANKYRQLEKIPVEYGTDQMLYHSERHMLDQIGDHPEMNMSEFARVMGVTRGAVSQVVQKLESKGVVKRRRSIDNQKEVFLELTATGRQVYRKHQQINKASIQPLVEELNKYSDDKVYFLLDMFKWFDGFLDAAREEMRQHTIDGH